MRSEVWLSLGSNLEPTAECERHLQAAHAELATYITELQCSSIYTTPAEGHAHGTYANSVVRGFTTMSEEELETALKALERAHGRTPADKLVGRVPLDLDIIRWNESIVRPRNWQMNYMQSGLKELSDETY
jgi:2-amino-4-hydroxy-6-hydroxymethyldihydropteridine diphosphokinase